MLRVICQEGSPGLRRRLAAPAQILATVDGATSIPSLSSSP